MTHPGRGVLGFQQLTTA